MTQWVITDTHFNHQAMQDYSGRPEDYTTRILRNWRESVVPGDVVIHLGDVILGQDDRLGELLVPLPGRKILVRGNHDQHPVCWYLEDGFAFVCDQFTQDGVLFTHEPVGQEALCGCRLNICGHLHIFAPEGDRRPSGGDMELCACPRADGLPPATARRDPRRRLASPRPAQRAVHSLSGMNIIEPVICEGSGQVRRSNSRKRT